MLFWCPVFGSFWIGVLLLFTEYEVVPLVEFMYLVYIYVYVYTRVQNESLLCASGLCCCAYVTSFGR